LRRIDDGIDPAQCRKMAQTPTIASGKKQRAAPFIQKLKREEM
jgi:hypothetical protein